MAGRTLFARVSTMAIVLRPRRLTLRNKNWINSNRNKPYILHSPGGGSPRLLGRVEIVSRQRKLGETSDRVFAGHDLKNLQRAVTEAGRHASQIRHPQPITLGTDQANRLFAAGRKPLTPVT